MSQNLPNMLQETISKIREMVDVNNVMRLFAHCMADVLGEIVE